MRKVVIVSYYEFKDYFINLSELFKEKYKWDVVNYPLYMYCYDKHSKINNYTDHFIEFIKKESPHIILWWFIDVKLSIFHNIKQIYPNIFYVIYNFNDPHNLNITLFNKCKIFDLIMTTCRDSLKLYYIHGRNNNEIIFDKKKLQYETVKFFPMPYDPNIFKEMSNDELEYYNDENYKCDISFYCDMLYENTTKYQCSGLSRKELIVALDEYAKENNKVFKLYGPEFLSIISSNYCGDVSYINMSAMVNSSKINIISHTHFKKDLAITNNELKILACKGISNNIHILMDKCKGVSKFYGNAVYFYNNKIELISNLDILLNKNINIKNNNSDILFLRNVIAEYTWEQFVSCIYTNYILYSFDLEWYNKTYDMTFTNIVDAYNDYNNKDSKNIIPYQIDIPIHFNAQNYIENYELSSHIDNKNKLNSTTSYIHWLMNGQKPEFISKSNNNNSNIDITNMNTTMSTVFDLYSIFNNIYISHDFDDGLKNIISIVENNPGIQINDILDSYFSNI